MATIQTATAVSCLSSIAVACSQVLIASDYKKYPVGNALRPPINGGALCVTKTCPMYEPDHSQFDGSTPDVSVFVKIQSVPKSWS